VTTPNGSTAAVTAAVDRFVARVGHWTPERWTAPAMNSPSSSGRNRLRESARSDAVTRADVVFGLVQSLADLAADVEGNLRRRVPRLDSDVALPDQVRVMIADLQAVQPVPVAAFVSAVAMIDGALDAL
jgi:hypothetical protein